MDALFARCCGLDIHKKLVVACRTTPGPTGKPHKEIRSFGTTTSAIEILREWGGFDHSDSEQDGEFPRLRALRVGIHVSLGARQAVRSAGAALGMEPPRVNSVAAPGALVV